MRMPGKGERVVALVAKVMAWMMMARAKVAHARVMAGAREILLRVIMMTG